MDEALKQLLGQGILGVVCVILLFALRTIFNLYVKSQEARIDAAAQQSAVIERNTASMNALVEVVKSKG